MTASATPTTLARDHPRARYGLGRSAVTLTDAQAAAALRHPHAESARFRAVFMELQWGNSEEFVAVLGFFGGDYRRAEAALAGFRGELYRLQTEAFVASMASLGRDRPSYVMARHPSRAGESLARRRRLALADEPGLDHVEYQRLAHAYGRLSAENLWPRHAQRKHRRPRWASELRRRRHAVMSNAAGDVQAFIEGEPEREIELWAEGYVEAVHARARIDLEVAAGDVAAREALLEPAAEAEADLLLDLDDQAQPGEHERMDWLDPPPQLLALTDTVLTAAPPLARVRAMHAA
jgi:hypothetical protein